MSQLMRLWSAGACGQMDEGWTGRRMQVTSRRRRLPPPRLVHVSGTLQSRCSTDEKREKESEKSSTAGFAVVEGKRTSCVRETRERASVAITTHDSRTTD